MSVLVSARHGRRAWVAHAPRLAFFWVLWGLVCLCGCDLGLFQPRRCGGPDNVPCGVNRYCEFEVGDCLTGGVVGVCAGIPEACTEIYQPVCGCAGITYANECLAAAAGDNVATRGTCAEAASAFCGGIAGVSCPDGQFCNFESEFCGNGDQGGVCTPIPRVCTEILDLVCGCNGITYLNECLAHEAGASVARRGACK